MFESWVWIKYNYYFLRPNKNMLPHIHTTKKTSKQRIQQRPAWGIICPALTIHFYYIYTCGSYCSNSNNTSKMVIFIAFSAHVAKIHYLARQMIKEADKMNTERKIKTHFFLRYERMLPGPSCVIKIPRYSNGLTLLQTKMYTSNLRKLTMHCLVGVLTTWPSSPPWR